MSNQREGRECNQPQALPADELRRCYDLWVAGAWPQSSQWTLVMTQIKLLMDASELPHQWAWRHLDGSMCPLSLEAGRFGEERICFDHDRRVRFS